jgi:hypothetical protein
VRQDAGIYARQDHDRHIDDQGRASRFGMKTTDMAASATVDDISAGDDGWQLLNVSESAFARRVSGLL